MVYVNRSFGNTFAAAAGISKVFKAFSKKPNESTRQWPNTTTGTPRQHNLQSPPKQIFPGITPLIINMTKLLDADWLRGVQLFH